MFQVQYLHRWLATIAFVILFSSFAVALNWVHSVDLHATRKVAAEATRTNDLICNRDQFRWHFMHDELIPRAFHQIEYPPTDNPDLAAAEARNNAEILRLKEELLVALGPEPTCEG